MPKINRLENSVKKLSHINFGKNSKKNELVKEFNSIEPARCCSWISLTKIKNRKAIQKSLNELSRKPRSAIPSLCEELLQRINKLEKEATDATRFLPTYDQKQLTLQIRTLIEELNTKKAELVPKSKFSFKSRKSNRAGKDATNSDGEDRSTTPTKEITTAETLINENFQAISYINLQNVYINIDTLGDTRDKVFDFHLSNLDHCIVNLVNPAVTIGAMHIKGLRNTIIMSGPVGSSILIYDCERCLFLVGCHQSSILQTAKLDQENNKYDKVEDFNWLKQQASPNWKVIPEEKWRKDWSSLQIDNPDSITGEDIKSRLNEILGSQ
ncbi:6019_t:CDS:2 [Acaulospora colombiana]|uniref:6019_t:CDS:1 n=1 Tax=Acaulospora colombiana TaxID=27376 RepID=A0ACA9KGL5_9GLOM|nr:6019_t:CDS:2 [Acaulospora colombiana]